MSSAGIFTFVGSWSDIGDQKPPSWRGAIGVVAWNLYDVYPRKIKRCYPSTGFDKGTNKSKDIRYYKLDGHVAEVLQTYRSSP